MFPSLSLAPHPSAVTHDPIQPTQTLSAPAQPAYLHSSHLPPVSAPASTNSQQQELQAKILSMFNSGASSAVAASPSPAPQPQGYTSSLGPQNTGLQSSLSVGGVPKTAVVQPQSMMSARPAPRPPVSRMPGPQRPAVTAGTGINFDNPSVQKALDTLIQSNPINHLVNLGGMGQAPRSAPQGMDQGPPPMSHYSRHY